MNRIQPKRKYLQRHLKTDYKRWNDMTKSKVIFDDQGTTKRVDGEVDISDNDLVKIIADDGRLLYVNKKAILFIKELPQ